MVSTPQRPAHPLFVVAMLTTLIAVPMLATVGGGPGWGMIGNDATNSRNQPLERRIGPTTPSPRCEVGRDHHR